MALFETLLEMDDQMVNWLLHASPTNQAERVKMKHVFALRGDLDDLLNELVAQRIKLSIAPLAEETARLNSIAGEMKRVEATIETVDKVLAIAGTAVEICRKLVAAVA